MMNILEIGTLELLLPRDKPVPSELTKLFPPFKGKEVKGSHAYQLYTTTIEHPLTREEVIELHMQWIVRRTILSWAFNGDVATLETVA